MKRPLPRWIPGTLLGLGLLQMAGDGLGSQGIKALAAATLLSPAPKVFSAVDGLETFSIRIELEWLDRSGEGHHLELTPEIAAHLRGPYNRRNVYGAALAYGPILRQSKVGAGLMVAVLEYALGPQGNLLRELGVDPDSVAGPVTIRWTPKHGGEGLALDYRVERGSL
ncbi:MAG TPA: hypothetical protein P5218_00825 [Planctomycetota bacterium]|nr:hypothetical protein [Planctomycetota bacterium]HRV79941.1 hypothetical protein [Planctomycetota bacterium]